MTDEVLRTQILDLLIAHEKDGPNGWLDTGRVARELALDVTLIERQVKALERDHLVEAYRRRGGYQVRVASYDLKQPGVTQRSFVFRRFATWSRGDWFAVIACVAALLAIPGLPRIFHLDNPPSAVVAVELLDPYSGFEIRTWNQGRIAARGIEVEISVWTYGAPARYTQTFSVHDLGPQSGFTIQGSLSDPRLLSTFPGIFDKQASVSGYIVASCANCANPRAWAFHIHGGFPNDVQMEFPNSVLWRIIEFRYPSEAPEVGVCVDFPAGACVDAYTSAPSLWRGKR